MVRDDKKIKNVDLAKILSEIAFLLEMKEDNENDPNVVFKVRSYKAASNSIANSSSNIDEVYREGGLKALMHIPSVGKAIASKIEEYLTSGKIQYLEELRSKTNLDYAGFYGLEGIGPKTIKLFYDKLGVRNLSDLEKAASQQKLRSIKGFSEKKEDAILKKIQIFKKVTGRYGLKDLIY
jgi:DNA polymerase (family X)